MRAALPAGLGAAPGRHEGRLLPALHGRAERDVLQISARGKMRFAQPISFNPWIIFLRRTMLKRQSCKSVKVLLEVAFL